MRTYQVAIVVRRAEAKLSDGYRYRSDAQYIHLLVKVDKAVDITFITGIRHHLELAEKLVRLYENSSITSLIEDGRSLVITDIREPDTGFRHHPADYHTRNP